jgi:acetyl esterase
MRTLDPAARQLLDMMAAAGGPPLESLPPPVARQAAEAGFKMLQGPPEAVAEVRDLVADGPAGKIPLRLYRPAGSEAGAALPACVYIHGGGFVIGSVPLYDNLCRLLANAAGCVVVSVEYRLAPEQPFPAAVEDCFAALRWVAAQAGTLGIDAGRLAVGGDSAGGNLAAVCALLARDQGGPALRYQVLIYPVTDMRGGTPSYHENGEGYFLTKPLMQYWLGSYLGDKGTVDDWRASPLLAPRHDGLPPASILVCGFDPLHDDGVRYAEALKKAGVPVRFTALPDQIHGLLTFDGALPAAKPTIAALGAELRDALQ